MSETMGAEEAWTEEDWAQEWVTWCADQCAPAPKTAKRRNLPAPAWQVWLTASLPVLMLLPFLDKAFHIDDTVYLRVA
ncbi:MAG: hypothetical protein VCD00_10245, partial [Candidatus Hydrogenedentota bacterium]